MKGMVLILLVLLLAGCSKVNKANFDRLKVGMTYDQVVAILGKPSSCSSIVLAEMCTWGDERRSITVNFVGKQALFFTSSNLR